MKGFSVFNCSERLLQLRLTIYFALAACLSNAQLSQPDRFEVVQKNSDHNFNIISTNDEGLLLIRDNEKYEEGKKIWELTVLDTTLQKIADTKLPLEPQLNLIGHEYLPGQVFLLFRRGETNTTNLQLIIFSLSTQEYKSHDIKHQVDFKLTHFSVCGATVIFGGYMIREPMVLLYTIAEKQLKVLPGLFLKDTELLDVRVNHNRTFNVLMAERKSVDEKKLLVRTFDETGAMLIEDTMLIEHDKNLLTGMTSSLVHDEMIVVGTYGDVTSKQARGFYSAIVDPFSDQAINYTDLTQLEHFVDYLGTKRATKVKQNAQEQRQRGKTPLFKSSVSLIRIHEVQKGFLLLAEVYDPSSGMNTSPQWNSYPSGYGYTSGYYPSTYFPYGGRYYSTPYSGANSPNSLVKMLESVTILFNQSGKIDWDEGFKLSEIKYVGLAQTSDFVEQSNGLLMAYKKKSDILSKKAFLDEATEAVLDTTKIKTLSEDDVIRSESEEDGGVRQWYNNFFYSWGYQTLRNQTKKAEDPTRHVFYINKIKTD
jgi:hypothetical protein